MEKIEKHIDLNKLIHNTMERKMEKTEIYTNLIKKVHRIYCDECGKELSATGLIYAVYPQLYQYECPKCKKLYKYSTLYPWEEICGRKNDEPI